MGAVDIAVVSAEQLPGRKSEKAKTIVNKGNSGCDSPFCCVRHVKWQAAQERNGWFRSSGQTGLIVQDSDPEKMRAVPGGGRLWGWYGENRASDQVISRAILPLKVKILNAEKAMEHKIYENDEIKEHVYSTGGEHWYTRG